MVAHKVAQAKEKHEPERITPSLTENAHTKTLRLAYSFSAVFLVALLIGTSFGMLIDADPPASAPDTVIDWEGLTAYSVNGIRYANPSDTDSIQDAIDDLHLNHNGGLVILPEGDYAMPNGSNILLHSNIALVGVGWGAHLTWADPANFFAISFNSAMNRGLVQDIWVTGFGRSHGIASTAFGANQCQNITISHVRMNEWSDDAMVLARCAHVTIADCEIYDTHEGLEFSACSYSTMQHNAVENTVQECVEIRSYSNAAGTDYPCQFITITDNVLNQGSMTNRVIWLYGNVSRVIITDNHIKGGATGIETTAVYGVGVQKTNGLLLANNYFTDCTLGFYSGTQSDRDLQIATNQFIGCTIAVYFPQKVTNASITSNLIKWCNGTSGYGVRSTQSTTTGLLISANTFLGIGKYAIHVGLCRPMVQGNQFIGTGEAAIMAYSNTSFISNSVSGATVAGVYIPSPEKNVSVIGNSFTDCAYAVRTFTSADYTRIIGNNFVGCTAILSLTGTHNVIDGNIGYVSEAYGSATVTGAVNYLYIYTGLSGSASTAMIVGNNSGIGDYWITSLTSTITVYFTNAPGTSIWKFYWYAEV